VFRPIKQRISALEQSSRPALAADRFFERVDERVQLLGENLEEAFDRLAAGLTEDDLVRMAKELRAKRSRLLRGIWSVE
jgi:hypothetical protein